jgi:hypothetical protein
MGNAWLNALRGRAPGDVLRQRARAPRVDLAGDGAVGDHARSDARGSARPGRGRVGAEWLARSRSTQFRTGIRTESPRSPLPTLV